MTLSILVIGTGDPTLGSEVFPENPDAFFINGVEALKKSLPADKDILSYVVDTCLDITEFSGVDMDRYR
jgi:hypothetical protein